MAILKLNNLVRGSGLFNKESCGEDETPEEVEEAVEPEAAPGAEGDCDIELRFCTTGEVGLEIDLRGVPLTGG